MANSLMVWGHRGHRHHRFDGRHGFHQPPHENSLKAYQQVLKVATGLECDVVQSNDNTPFLVHDTMFNGITKYELKNHLDEASQLILQDRFIFQLSNDELENIRLKDGQSLPRLSQLLNMMPEFQDRYLNLELKGPSVANSAVRTVERAIRKRLLHPQQVIFSSYNLPTLHNLRLNVGQRFKISVMLTPADLELAQMYPNWPNAEQNAYYVPFSIQALQRSDIREIQPDFLYIEAHSLTKAGLESVQELYPDIKIILWCAGEQHPDEDSFFIDAIIKFERTKSLFAVISDFPDMIQNELLKRHIGVKKPHNPFAL